MILVSKSPRRQEILRNAGFDFEVIDSNISEDYPDSINIEEIPVFLAEKKAKSVQNDYKNEILIACDTIVVLDNAVLGKPKSDADAKEILLKISGNVHKVITGVCILLNDRITKFSDESLVYFKALNDNEIDYYVSNYKPYDKAGAYGIQEWIGLIGVEKIEGSFYNVMGLPIHKLYRELNLIK